MRIDLVTVFPEWCAALADLGVTGRAIKSGRVALHTWNPRDYTTDRHRTVDDRPYGGGPGMVMMAEPLAAAIDAARRAAPEAVKVAVLSPQGRRFEQAAAHEMADRERLLFVCGRYEGIDERLLATMVDEEWSIGDYVLSGGELAAAVVVDAVVRLLPGVLGDARSAADDSFSTGLLDHPHYTRPEVFRGSEVPPVLRSGDHQAIARWRRREALGRTWLRRPDLLTARALSTADRALLDDFIATAAQDAAPAPSDTPRSVDAAGRMKP